MSEYIDNHPLGRDFPDLKDRIHELKTGNAHFRNLMDHYETTDREVVRAEQGLDHLSDQALEELKLQRVKLKDDLYAALKS